MLAYIKETHIYTAIAHISYTQAIFSSPTYPWVPGRIARYMPDIKDNRQDISGPASCSAPLGVARAVSITPLLLCTKQFVQVWDEGVALDRNCQGQPVQTKPRFCISFVLSRALSLCGRGAYGL